MHHDRLRFEVQMMDGTPEASLKAMELIVNELKSEDYLPRTIEYNFLEEFYKCLIDWMSKGEVKQIEKVYQHIKSMIKNDHDFRSPFEGSTSKKRFGAHLNMLMEIAEVYLRTDFESKDTANILGNSSSTKKLRLLLSKFYIQNRFVTIKDIQQFPAYKGIETRTIQRQLDKLAEWDLIRKNYNSAKKISYELTPKGYYLKEKILDNQKTLYSVDDKLSERTELVIGNPAIVHPFNISLLIQRQKEALPLAN
jgi:DNA-binding HxlR family transcriptional regulator